jgi:peroxiredoxin
MFRRISLQWQNLGTDPDERRENAIAIAKTFAREFPADRRSPRLLAEAESLCDNHPEEKAPLIAEAMALSKEDSISQRLQDDKNRLELLGKQVDLSFESTKGQIVDLSKEKGNVVAVVFWSAESAPSLIWLRYFCQYASGVSSLKVMGISLDTNRADLNAAMQALHINWPVNYDGKGWQNAIARKYGINALPTLWLIDREGRLASLNARDNYVLKINELLLKK